ncbi:Uncharacterized protein ChrSV_2389 [Chromobacterium vaccinii]|nr:Uncharacterized protein ChrSW_2389 [Chromobacterium vaccinii]QND89846.1 Uncharacterized protein ChrSV_2389 [Chromobacterium vaccinii]
MSITEIGTTIATSFISGILVVIATKITLEKWKQMAFGLGTTILMGGLFSIIIFAGITATKEFTQFREQAKLQEKIEAYTKGHYPDDYEKGFRLGVVEIGQRPMLAFEFPDGSDYTGAHPWRNSYFEVEIQKLLNDNGYPGSPAWSYRVKPLSREQVDKLLERN